jgi:N6-L-threonylcarbamoyladenine synthase
MSTPAGPVLGIETSCDDTAAALVTADRHVLAARRTAQDTAHAPFGGIVPEIAARAHVERLDGLIAEVLAEAGIGMPALGAVAVTAGPGLIGGLVVGVVTAQAIAAVHDKPLVAVNHLEGHALSPRLVADVRFPYLLLLVSGGHCQLLVVEAVGRYRRLGTTLDDALGEAFDKVAKMLGLGFPGGPAVEASARRGDPSRFALPRPMLGQPNCHFSFSGLKTALRHAVLAQGDRLEDGERDDLCAAFQAAAFEALLDRVARGVDILRTGWPEAGHLVAAGGVAANEALRSGLGSLAATHGLDLIVPPPRLCTDNGEMIAWAGVERLRAGLSADAPRPRARWPLDPSAEPAPGAGVKA